MTKSTKIGFPLIGVMFLALGLAKFLSGGDWVVWIILGFVFGGFAIFKSREAEKGGIDE